MMFLIEILVIKPLAPTPPPQSSRAGGKSSVVYLIRLAFLWNNMFCVAGKISLIGNAIFVFFTKNRHKLSLAVSDKPQHHLNLLKNGN
jgi:hypothetical protein